MTSKPRGPLADHVERDPYEEPRTLNLPEGAIVQRALSALAPGHPPDRLLVASRASLPQNVIGATVGGPCCVCGEAVWLSPSSVRALRKPGLRIVCVGCVALKAIELLAADEPTETERARDENGCLQFARLFTIYERPSDYPGFYVVREWRADRDGNAVPADRDPLLLPTLETARMALHTIAPWATLHLPRTPEDDPVIVESWV